MQALLRDILGLPPVRRALGAGRKDDVGDIDGVPNTAVQVAWWARWTEAINVKLVDVERQQQNKRAAFAAVFIRRSRNPIPWIVVMTPVQWAKLWKFAQIGLKHEMDKRRALEREA